MRTRFSITLLASLGLLFLLLPAARADVVMQFVSANFGDSHGIYISPYTINVGGVDMLLFCNDFTDHVGSGYPSWNAKVIWGGDNAALETTRMAILSGKKDLDLQHLYDVKAWLEMNITDQNSRAVNSFAIWYLFQPDAVNNWLSGVENATFLGQVHTAASHNNDDQIVAGLRNRLTIYTPTGPYYTGGSEWAQEFNKVNNVPDGGVTLMLLGGVLVGLETLRRRVRA